MRSKNKGLLMLDEILVEQEERRSGETNFDPL
jgi:hypothetical protein